MHQRQKVTTTRSREIVFAWLNGAVVDSGEVGTGNHTVGGQVAVKDREEFQGTGGRAPVTHQLADDSKVGDDVDASFTHAVVGLLADVDGGGTRSLMIGPDAVTSFAERKSSESSACYFKGQKGSLLHIEGDRRCKMH